MNKIVAILGIIVVIMLGGLFFCAGFFTGSTMNPTSSANVSGPDTPDGKSTKDNVDALLDTKSETLSEKVMDLLASAADSAISTAENLTTKQNQEETSASADNDEQLTVDSLLREIASSHTSDDHCSPQTTQLQIDAPKPKNLQQGMQGKKIVFIGYFKNKIALQIQQLLQSKGYKTHVEISKSGEQNEAFVFCGPFKQEKNARKLVTWLRRHNFKEAHLISVSKEAVEETLYDFISEDSKLPANAEKDIPELSIDTVQTNAAQSVEVPQQTPQKQTVAVQQAVPQQMPQQTPVVNQMPQTQQQMMPQQMM